MKILLSEKYNARSAESKTKYFDELGTAEFKKLMKMCSLDPDHMDAAVIDMLAQDCS